MSEKCCEQIYNGTFRYSQCSRNGTIQRNGKWYCRQHDPVARQEARDSRHAKWAADLQLKRQEVETAIKQKQAWNLLKERFPDDPLEGLKKLLES